MKHIQVAFPARHPLWLGLSALNIIGFYLALTVAPAVFLAVSRWQIGLFFGFFCAFLAACCMGMLYGAAKYLGRSKPMLWALVGLFALTGWLAAYGALFLGFLWADPQLLLFLDQGGLAGSLLSGLFFPLPFLTAFACVCQAGFRQGLLRLIKRAYLPLFAAACLELFVGALVSRFSMAVNMSVSFLLSAALSLLGFAFILKTLAGLSPTAEPPETVPLTAEAEEPVSVS